jgi:hypothetical protein
MRVNLKLYRKNRVEKLEAVTTGINIERRHKIFVEENNLNLSALVRDYIDKLMLDHGAIEVKGIKINEKS